MLADGLTVYSLNLGLTRIVGSSRDVVTISRMVAFDDWIRQLPRHDWVYLYVIDPLHLLTL